MSKKKVEHLDSLIFIDTNIYLDFYRIRKSDISLKYLSEIEKYKDKIITSSQVEMEFKKNRQSVILQSIKQLNNWQKPHLSVPTIISDAKAAEMFEKSSKEIKKQQERLKKRIEGILKRPSRNDPVYKSLQRVYKAKTPYNLNRDNKERIRIRNLAKKRFILGYPPRKNNDVTIGDAIHWEWLLQCAITSGKHIIIVTRDTDFGEFYNDTPYINDWLLQEFMERVNKSRKLILTDKLSIAFELVDIPVTKEMKSAEETMINFSKYLESYRNSSEAFNLFARKYNIRSPLDPFKGAYERFNIPQPDFMNYWHLPFEEDNKND